MLKEMTNYSSYRNKEEIIIKRKERENSSRRLRDNRTDNVKMIIDFLIFNY